MADTTLAVPNDTSRSEILVLYGLTVLLAGLGVALDRRYPTWFGVAAAVAGALVAANALLAYAGVGLPREDFLVFLVIQPLEGLWLLVLGVLMWRRASAPSR